MCWPSIASPRRPSRVASGPERQRAAAAGTAPDTAYTLADLRRMRAARRYRAWQLEWLRPALGRRIVEVGCGIGNLTGLLLGVDGVEAVVALDHDPAVLAELQAAWGADARLRICRCEATPTGLTDPALTGFDTCVCVNVLEHLDDDAGALQAMVTMVRPGGAVALQVPAVPALYGALDRRLGHRRRYRRRDLAALARAAGAAVESLRYTNALGALFWWYNGRIAGREAQSERQIELFDRLLVPLSRWLERRSAPPWGQSLVAVLRRPAPGKR